MKKVVIIGSGGHAKVVIDIILQRQKKLNDDISIEGILDDSFIEGEEKKLFRIPVIGKIDKIRELSEDIYYVIAIGSNEIRKKIVEQYRDIKYITLIHPNSVIAEEVQIDEGTVIMAGAIVNPYTKIGKHCIVNTGSIIEHDNDLSNYVHISPNVTLCGGVKVGERTWIGAGATVIQGIDIEEKVVIGSNSVILKNIKKEQTVFGIPD
ncbi:MAG: acetyltransferase [Cetobacterium sp.]